MIEELLSLFLTNQGGDVTISMVAGFLGLLFGSFLNVVIHRLPIMIRRASESYVALEAGREPIHTDRFNLTVPRSACPHCHHQISACENIPIVSWLALQGKCRKCKAPISVRYPLVELLTGALSAFIVWRLGSGYAGLSSLIFLYMLIPLAFIDADCQQLPDQLTYPLLWTGLFFNLNAIFVPIQDAVIGAIAGYLILWLVYWLFKIATGKEGIGHGDFKLLAALGAWLGWEALPMIIACAAILATLGAVLGMVFKGNTRKAEFPFGPYLAAGGVIALSTVPKLVLQLL